MVVIVVFKLEHASSCAQEDYKLSFQAMLNATSWVVLQGKSIKENDHVGKIPVVILLNKIADYRNFISHKDFKRN